MIRPDAARPATFCDGLSRRGFLHAGAVGPLALTLPLLPRAKAEGAKDDGVNCIMLFLVGGPSQIDTWDPKPDAPAEVRGPFQPIRTNVTGMQVSEIFPRMAEHADKFSLVRTVHHTARAVHDAGRQLMQTGRLFGGCVEHPHVGCALGYLKGGRGELPAHVLLPNPVGRTGGNRPHGQTAGYLGKPYDPFVLNAVPNAPDFQVPDLRPTSAKARDAFALEKEPDATKDRYGRTRFGQSCLMARRLVEAGVRFVTVNMFETVFGEVTWDIHGSKPFTDIVQMAKEVAPNFDRAYTGLLEDLSDRGLLSNTMVVAVGEFGRTPKVNPAGGRDHHPGAWTVVIGGGPIQGGRVVGETDALGYTPKSRPVMPGEIVATLYKGLGLDPHTELPGPQNRPLPLVDYGVQPIGELF